MKKLVYVYLVRYAEEQQDLALLSISTFQRGLKVTYGHHFLKENMKLDDNCDKHFCIVCVKVLTEL